MKSKHSIFYLLWQQNTISNWPIYHNLYDKCHADLTKHCLPMLGDKSAARIIAYEAILELFVQLDYRKVKNPDIWIINLVAEKCQHYRTNAVT